MSTQGGMPVNTSTGRLVRRRAFLARVAGSLTGMSGLSCAMTRNGAGTTCGKLAASPWKKCGVVLSSGSDGMIQNFTSAAEPLEAKRWRLWLSVSGQGVPFNVGIADGVPGEGMERHLAVLSEGEPADAPLAIGNLPRDWRPVQGVHVPLAKGRHRLYFWAHGPKVVRYLAAESDDGRRYRVIDPSRPCLYHPADRAVDGRAASEAGLKKKSGQVSTRPAGEPAALARQISNDATNVYRLSDGTFEMYSVGLVEVGKEHPGYVAHDNCAGWIRVIDRYASKDGLDWPERRRILVPDAKDPADQQFYYLSVTHTPYGRIGTLGHYRVEAQTMDIEACFSKDGLSWQRAARSPWIPRGKPGEPDSYMVYAPHSLVERDGLWHLFYTATTEAHNHKHSHGSPMRSIMYATCQSPWA